MKAIVTVSGGMDSAVVLALALQECDRVLAVSFHYGSRHQDQESNAAAQLCEHFNVLRHVIFLPQVFYTDDSALSGRREMPHLSYQQIAEAMGPSPTVVPFRNANIISLATTIAVTEHAQRVYVAVHGEDSRNFAYPDCTPEFIGAMQAAVYVGTYHEVRLLAPFQYLSKADIVWIGKRLEVPFDLTWSCYDPLEIKGSADEGVGIGPDYVACGKCPTCVERLEAFKANGLTDPIDYYNV